MATRTARKRKLPLSYRSLQSGFFKGNRIRLVRRQILKLSLPQMHFFGFATRQQPPDLGQLAILEVVQEQVRLP